MMKLKNTKEEIPSFMKRKSETAKPAKTSKPKETKNLHSGHRDRLKNQYMINGIHSMTEIQQLELLLFYAIPQKDTNPIAHKLLDKFGCIKNVLNANVRDLCTVDGIKENSATFLKVVSNMATVCSLPKPGATITGSIDAMAFCEKFYVGVNLEQFHVVCLNGDNKVIGSKMIKAGTVDQINVNICDITQFAMSLNSDRIIVSHNHPDGPGRMSDEDCRFTYSLICSCLLNSIELLDHVVVGTDKTFSFHENQIMEKLVERARKNVLISKEVQIMLSSIRKTYNRDNTYDFDFKIDF